MKNLLWIALLLIVTASPAQAACFFNQQQVLVCTPDSVSQEVRPPSPTEVPGIYPFIREQELQRAIILGNPPRPPQIFHQPPPLTRPEEIPNAYPMRRQDGIRFY